MATPLFSQSTRKLAPGSLVEFKAGRLFRDGETNWVVPDTKRGVCYVKRDDGLLRFVWKERTRGNAEVDELIVFPGDVHLERVKQSSGRVYVLKFKSSKQRLFFWMQGAEEEEDSDVIHEMNVVLSGGEEDMEEEEEEEEEEGEEEELLQRRGSREAEALSHQHEQSALARESPAMDSSLATAQVGGVSNVRVASREPGNDVTMGSGLDSLRQMLLDSPSSSSRQQTRLQLGDVLTRENLMAVLADERLHKALFPTLPENVPRTRGALDRIIRSPQFQQALDSLSYVLESGQMAGLVGQLGLDPSASSSVEAFLKAIARQAEKDDKMQE
ncbi:proteasome complex subunit Rpn13 ubiquitin receptor-domain-containing protein [Coemansia spiralis]|nr:proteasome complex subunit Rpn13 ubiquitin receptor-domain-containing protein [Coemansia spiralis]